MSRPIKLFVLSAIVLGLASMTANVALAQDTVTLDITVEGPNVPDVAKEATVEVRIFDGHNVDAPPVMTNIAVQAFQQSNLTFPLNLKMEVSKPRLALALAPSIGVLVSSGGNILYWTATRADLSWGQTTVRVSDVE